MSLTLQDLTLLQTNTRSRSVYDVNNNVSELSLLQTCYRGESSSDVCYLRTLNRLHRVLYSDVGGSGYTQLVNSAQRSQFSGLQKDKPVFGALRGEANQIEASGQSVKIISVQEGGSTLSWSFQEEMGECELDESKDSEIGSETKEDIAEHSDEQNHRKFVSPGHMSSPSSLLVRYRAVLEQAYSKDSWGFSGQAHIIQSTHCKYVLLLNTLGHVIVLQYNPGSLRLVEVVLAGHGETCCLSRQPCPSKISAFSSMTVDEDLVYLGDVFGYIHIQQEFRPAFCSMWAGFTNTVASHRVFSRILKPDSCPCYQCPADYTNVTEDMAAQRMIVQQTQDTKTTVGNAVGRKGTSPACLSSLALGIVDMLIYKGNAFLVTLQGDQAVLPSSLDALRYAEKSVSGAFQAVEATLQGLAMQAMMQNHDPARLKVLLQLASFPKSLYPLLQRTQNTDMDQSHSYTCISIYNGYILCGTRLGKVRAFSVSTDTSDLLELGVILEYPQFTKLQHTNLIADLGQFSEMDQPCLPVTSITLLPAHSDAPTHGQLHPCIPCFWSIQYNHTVSVLFAGTFQQQCSDFPVVPMYPHQAAIQQVLVEKYTDAMISERCYFTPCNSSTTLYAVMGTQVYKHTYPSSTLYQYSTNTQLDIISNTLSHVLLQVHIFPYLCDGIAATMLNRDISPQYAITVPETQISGNSQEHVYLQCIYEASIKNPLQVIPYETMLDISAAFHTFPEYELYKVTEAVFFSSKEKIDEYTHIYATSMICTPTVPVYNPPRTKQYPCIQPENTTDNSIFKTHSKNYLTDTIVMGFKSNDAIHSSTRSYMPNSTTHKTVDVSLLSFMQYIEYASQLKTSLLTDVLQKAHLSNYLPQEHHAEPKPTVYSGLQKLYHDLLIQQDKYRFHSAGFVPLHYTYYSRTEVVLVFLCLETGDLECGLYDMVRKMTQILSITDKAPLLIEADCRIGVHIFTSLTEPQFCVRVSATLVLFHTAGIVCIADISEQTVNEFSLQTDTVCQAEIVETKHVYVVLRNVDDILVLQHIEEKLDATLTLQCTAFHPLASLALTDIEQSVAALVLFSPSQEFQILNEHGASEACLIDSSKLQWLAMNPKPSLYTSNVPSQVLGEYKIVNTQYQANSDGAKQPLFTLIHQFCPKYNVNVLDTLPKLQPALQDVSQILNGIAHIGSLQQVNTEGLPAYAAFPVYNHTSPYAMHYTIPTRAPGPRTGMNTKAKTKASLHLFQQFESLLSVLNITETSHISAVLEADTVSVVVTSLSFHSFMHNPVPPLPTIDIDTMPSTLTLLGTSLSYTSPYVCSSVGSLLQNSTQIERLSKQEILKFVTVSPLLAQVQCTLDESAIQLHIQVHVQQTYPLIISTPSAKLQFPPPFHLRHSLQSSSVISQRTYTMHSAMEPWVKLLFQVQTLDTPQRHQLGKTITHQISETYHKTYLDSYIAVCQIYSSLCNVPMIVATSAVSITAEQARETALLSVFISLVTSSPRRDILHRIFEFLHYIVPETSTEVPQKPALWRICEKITLAHLHPLTAMVKRCQQRQQTYHTPSTENLHLMRYIVEVSRFADASTSLQLLGEFSKNQVTHGNFLQTYYQRCFDVLQALCRDQYGSILECQEIQEEMIILAYIPNPLVDALMESSANFVTTAHIALPDDYYTPTHYTQICTLDPLASPSIVPKTRTLVISHCEGAHILHSCDHVISSDQHDLRHHCECTRKIEETTIEQASVQNDGLAQALKIFGITVEETKKPNITHEYTLQFPNDDTSNAVLSRHEAMGSTEAHTVQLQAYTVAHATSLRLLLRLQTLLMRHTSAFKQYETHLGIHYSSLMAAETHKVYTWLLHILHTFTTHTAPPLPPTNTSVQFGAPGMRSVYEYVKQQDHEESKRQLDLVSKQLLNIEKVYIEPIAIPAQIPVSDTPLDATSLIELDVLDNSINLFGVASADQQEDTFLPISNTWRTMRTKNSKHAFDKHEELADAMITVDNFPLYLTQIEGKEYPMAYYMNEINVSVASNVERAVFIGKLEHIERIDPPSHTTDATRDEIAFHQATQLLDSYRSKVLPTIFIGKLTLVNIPTIQYTVTNILNLAQDNLRYSKNFLLKMSDIEEGATVREDQYLPTAPHTQ